MIQNRRVLLHHKNLFDWRTAADARDGRRASEDLGYWQKDEDIVGRWRYWLMDELSTVITVEILSNTF
jgi:hypothetical protein